MQIYPYKNQIYENLNQQHDINNLFIDSGKLCISYYLLEYQHNQTKIKNFLF